MRRCDKHPCPNRATSTVTYMGTVYHFCDADADELGAGDDVAFPQPTWEADDHAQR